MSTGQRFVSAILAAAPDPDPSLDRPFVTVTYAQSLDGRVASLPGQPRLLVSGVESMDMTFACVVELDAQRFESKPLAGGSRSLLHRKCASLTHVAFVARTMRSSSVSTRLSPTTRSCRVRAHSGLLADGAVRGVDAPPVRDWPLPIILDARLRTPLACRLLSNAERGTGRAPLIVHARSVADSAASSALRSRGAELLAADTDASGMSRPWLGTDHTGRIDLIAALSALRRLGIKRLMIESGVRLTPALLGGSRPFADLLVVTTGTQLVGEQGRQPEPLARPPRLERLRSELFGTDWVVASRVIA